MLRIRVLQAVVCGALLLASGAIGQQRALPGEGPVCATDLGDSAPRSIDGVPEGLDAADWSSIREAYEANRHAAFAVDGGHRARNPGQQWATLFDGRGFQVTPDAESWTWGLDLVRYGWGEDERAVERPRSVSAEGGRMAYAWDEQLTEWYVNDRRGLEHGYTVHARPAEASGPLSLALTIRGGLEPVVSENGRDVRFVDPECGAVLTYAGLTVLDADGRALPAGWHALADGLQLRVDEQDARYPLTIDPIAQQAYLKASNTDASDAFGSSVSVSGDTVVVGAYRERSNATGVNGDQSNNSLFESGAAYVFVRSGTTWSQQAYLKASNTEAGDQFGYSVSVSGDTVVVGADGEDSNATGVNGDQSNNSFSLSGAAYVFVRIGTTWSQQAYLKASNTQSGDFFGLSVSVSGDTVVVGAFLEDSNATGVGGDESNNSASGSGAAYVFVRSGTTWSQQAYLKASNTEPSDQFGFSVSVSGDTVVVGAFLEDSNATVVGGDESNNSASASGAAYVFVRSGTTWSQQVYLKASNTEAIDEFGFSVSVSGNTVVVAAPLEDSNATGVGGDESNNSASASGAAYVFVRNVMTSTWSQQAYLKASNTESNDEFGFSASVSGDAVVVGAPLEDSNATGVGGVQSDNSAGDSGAAYVFVRCGLFWGQQAYLKASNTGAQDLFGLSVSISGETVIVGATSEDSNATGVGGIESDNSATDAGAVYVFFDLEFCSPAAVAIRECPPNNKVGSLVCSPAALGGTLSLTCLTPGKAAAIAFAFDSPFNFTLSGGQCLLCIDLGGNGELMTGGGLSLFPAGMVGGCPQLDRTVPVPPDPNLAGFVFYIQAIMFVPGPFALSSACDMTIGS